MHDFLQISPNSDADLEAVRGQQRSKFPNERKDIREMPLLHSNEFLRDKIQIITEMDFLGRNDCMKTARRMQVLVELRVGGNLQQVSPRGGLRNELPHFIGGPQQRHQSVHGPPFHFHHSSLELRVARRLFGRFGFGFFQGFSTCYCEEQYQRIVSPVRLGF